MGIKRDVILAWAVVGTTGLGTDASADIINVPADFGTIQAAIADPGTVDGDEVVVAAGTYAETIDFLGKAITVRSSGGAGVTTIDGTGAFHVVQCVSGEGPDTVLDGFTITGGNANGAFPNDLGGGMYNNGSSPTVTKCIFSGNTAKRGGGMYNLNGSNPQVTDCLFIDNMAVLGGGGGMNNAHSSPTVTNCTFSGNSATAGGGGPSPSKSAPAQA